MLDENLNNFLDHWPHVEKSLRNKDVLLFLDYDGTLAPIAETPAEAVMMQGTRDVVTELSKLPQCHLVVISGRQLSDLKRMIDIPNITYVGNHGFEMEEASFHLEDNLISRQYFDDLKFIKGALAEKLSSAPGVWIEDKGIVASIHFRQATKVVELLTKKKFFNISQSYLESQRISVMEGKKVLEVRPPIQWNKGESALWILSKWQQKLGKDQVVSIYVGDDTTDEDAFRNLRDVAVTIKVGQSDNSFARYFLPSQKDVLTLLENMKALLTFPTHS